MAKLLFRLKGVFDDEAEDIRSLLRENRIDFYESPAGNWGISVHALWLNNDTDYDQARVLIDQYQAERSQRQQEQPTETLWQRIQSRPLQFIIYGTFILLILYLSIMPFLQFGDQP